MSAEATILSKKMKLKYPAEKAGVLVSVEIKIHCKLGTLVVKPISNELCPDEQTALEVAQEAMAISAVAIETMLMNNYREKLSSAA